MVPDMVVVTGPTSIGPRTSFFRPRRAELPPQGQGLIRTNANTNANTNSTTTTTTTTTTTNDDNYSTDTNSECLVRAPTAFLHKNPYPGGDNTLIVPINKHPT